MGSGMCVHPVCVQPAVVCVGPRVPACIWVCLVGACAVHVLRCACAYVYVLQCTCTHFFVGVHVCVCARPLLLYTQLSP